MEEVIARFPDLGTKIFDHLNNEDLQNCLKVSRSWNTFIYSQKSYWIRIIKKFVKESNNYKQNVRRLESEIALYLHVL